VCYTSYGIHFAQEKKMVLPLTNGRAVGMDAIDAEVASKLLGGFWEEGDIQQRCWIED
jgi:hypothetical protein